MPDLEQMACRYFCRAEASELLSLGGPRVRQEAFFRCWTRKEAYIKAVGDGLHMPLDQFQVTLLPDDPPRFVQIDDDEKIASEWILQHIEPAPGYVGAVSYCARRSTIKVQGPMDANELLGSSWFSVNRRESVSR
jgi:4'-phosphopantetheinyl transferase